MQRILRIGTAILLTALAACSRGPKPGAPSPEARPFDAFATQRIVVTPAGFVRGGDSLGWVQAAGGNRTAARMLDSAINKAFEDRGLAQRWIMPTALQRTFEKNRSYATDPYLLAMEPLRSPTFISGKKYGEPLSSQLRTMIALEADTRFVLLPIEFRFEKVGAGARGILRVALLDPRSAESRFVGEVKGLPGATAAVAFASVGYALADLFVAP